MKQEQKMQTLQAVLGISQHIQEQILVALELSQTRSRSAAIFVAKTLVNNLAEIEKQCHQARLSLQAAIPPDPAADES